MARQVFPWWALMVAAGLVAVLAGYGFLAGRQLLAGLLAGGVLALLWLLWLPVRFVSGALTATAAVSLVAAGVFVLLPVVAPSAVCAPSGCTGQDVAFWALSGLSVPWTVLVLVAPVVLLVRLVRRHGRVLAARFGLGGLWPARPAAGSRGDTGSTQRRRK